MSSCGICDLYMHQSGLSSGNFEEVTVTSIVKENFQGTEDYSLKMNRQLNFAA